jgi:hypothetical protein
LADTGAVVKRTCIALNRRGEPCGSRAITPDGRCAIHGGVVDPSELGKKGGRANGRVRSGLGPEVVDSDLRERARAKLHELLDSKNEATRLSAAKSLFSYATTPAPNAYTPTTTPPSIQRENDFAVIREHLIEAGALCPCMWHEVRKLTDAHLQEHLAAIQEEIARRLRPDTEQREGGPA